MKVFSSFMLMSVFLFSTAAFSQQLPGQQPTQSAEYTDDELIAFVNAAQKITPLQQESQQKMIEKIEGENLTVEQFNKIINSQSTGEIDATEEELESFNTAMEKVQEIQLEYEEVITEREFERIIEVAEVYKTQINIEVHGYFTTNPDMLERMLNFCDSDYLGLNMDTGNSFIAGNDPVEFFKRFINKVNHLHIKDVSEELADMLRGKDTGIALSHCAIGDGVNADNIKRILALLRDSGFTGVLSMECEGEGGPMIEKSLRWMRATMAELGIPETT